jgi:DNA repair protein RadC
MKNTIKVKPQTLPGYPIGEFEISYKSKPGNEESKKRMATSQDIYELLQKIYNSDTFGWIESFVLICLNRANRCTGFYKVSQGGITGTVADPRVILQVALMANATSIIISHNHPSGNLQPSRSDEDITQKIKQAAALLDIRLLDHIIVSEDGFYSFTDNGLI